MVSAAAVVVVVVAALPGLAPFARGEGAPLVRNGSAAGPVGAVGGGGGAPLTEELFWLHVPKCGSAFVNVACRLCCPGIPTRAKFGCEVVDHADHLGVQYGKCHWSDLGAASQDDCDVAWLNGFQSPKLAECQGGGRHLPYNRTSHAGKSLGLFRRPEARVVSGFKDRLHCWPTAGGTERAKVLRAVAAAKTEAAKIAAYATYCAPGACVANCMTKMLLGLECYGYAPHISPAMVREAVATLEDDFLMVGLTEEWDVSAALAHAAVRGDSAQQLRASELAKVRSTGDPAAQFAALEASRGWNPQRTEAADEVVYAHAAFLFWHQAADHGLVPAKRARRLAARAIADLDALVDDARRRRP